jgi:hypothetical protein
MLLLLLLPWVGGFCLLCRRQQPSIARGLARFTFDRSWNTTGIPGMSRSLTCQELEAHQLSRLAERSSI